MKKLLLFCIALLWFASCSNELHENVSNKIENEDLIFINLCSSLDSIGAEYDSPKTRAFNLNKWGGKFFSAVVDGVTGYISGPAGIVVGTLCSWAYDAYWERCTKLMSRTANMEKAVLRDTRITPTYVFAVKSELTREDSAGYYHNIILNELANSGKEYINDTGEIDYQNILTDCMEAAQKYGIAPELSSTDKKKYIAFSKDVVESFSACAQGNATLEDAFNNVNSSYIEKFKVKPNLEKAEFFQSKIINILNSIERNDSIKEYADKVNILLIKADIDSTLKSDLKTISDYTVNSRLYWISEQ